MDFDSPDVEKDFPGLYAESSKKNQSRDSDYSDDEKISRKDLLSKKREKKESKKDKGYVAFEGESSGDDMEETKSPGKNKKSKSAFKFPGKDKKEKHNKSKDRDAKEKKEEKEKEKICKKESKEMKKESKEAEKGKDKSETKKKKESKILARKKRPKDKKKKEDEQEITDEIKPIFGVPLQVAVEQSKSHDGIEIPVVVRECIDYIEEHGLACEGIYRISGLKSKLGQLKSQYNRREKVYLYEHEPHIVASLLKQFLRELPEPILTVELTPKFEEAAAMKNEKKRSEVLQKLLDELPNCNRLLLSWIFVHMLHVIGLEKRNKMNLQNVSIVLSPTLQISHHVLQALFAHSDVLFKGIEIKKYVPPLEMDSSRLSLELPDSPSAIAEELSRQENVLNVLHAELNAGLRDEQKEEQLWEIQRIVTQLKRKLRFLKQVQETTKPGVEETSNKTTETTKTDDTSINTVLQKPPIVVKLDHPVKIRSPDKENIAPSKKVISVSNDNKNTENVEASVVIPLLPQPHTQSREQDNGNANVLNASKNKSATAQERGDIQRKENSSIQSNNKFVPVVHPQQPEAFHSGEDNTLYHLLREEKMLQIQNEELLLLGDELRRKINSEKMEIERLRMEINEYQQLYKYKRYSFDSSENSSSDSDDSSASDAEEDMASVLESLIRENKLLEEKNNELSKVIQNEREISLDLKVQMKMLQQCDPKYMRS